MFSKQTKAYLICGVAAIGLSWACDSFLVGTIGTFAWVLPGIVAVAGMWIGGKLKNSI